MKFNCISIATSAILLLTETVEAASCYKQWVDIATEIYESAFDPAFEGKVFTLCKNTIFNAADATVSIYSSNIELRCEDQTSRSCLVNGGIYQVYVTEGAFGPPKNVKLTGLTFVSPESISVISYGDNIEMEVTNCEFKGSSDANSIGVYARGVDNIISVTSSYFHDNIYLTAIGAVDGALANILHTIFTNNEAHGTEGIVGAVGSGASVLSNESCFFQNNILIAEAMMLIDSQASNILGENNYSYDNFGSNLVCQGFIPSGDNSCTSFDATYCHANPGLTPSSAPTAGPTSHPSGAPIATPSVSPTKMSSTFPTIFPTEMPTVASSLSPTMAPTKPWCYSDWRTLTFDVTSVTLENAPLSNIFMICPNTTLDASRKPLYLWEKDTVIQCGEKGDVSDNCTITNGDYQIFVADNPLLGPPVGVKIKGMIFTNQQVASVVVYGDGGSHAIVDGCLFKDTVNNVAVSVYVSSSTTMANSILIENSEFENNQVLSLIGNVGGSVHVSKSFFHNNVAKGTESIIGFVESGSGSITSSCFIDNSIENSSGIAYIDSSSKMTNEYDNYGFGNDVFFTFCVGFHVLSNGGECIEPDSKFCKAPLYSELSPSALPSIAPTKQPSLVPSELPTSVYTSAPTHTVYISEVLGSENTMSSSEMEIINLVRPIVTTTVILIFVIGW